MNNLGKKSISIAAAFLAASALLPGAARASLCDQNRKLIRLDAQFTADASILNQACLMVELYYKTDEEDALLFDPEEPEVVFGKWSLRNLAATQAEDSVKRVKAALRAGVRELVASPEEEWTDAQKKLRRQFPQAWSPAQAVASADRAASRRGLRRAFRRSVEKSYQYRPLMDSVFKAQGIPNRLVFLPHVESWYNPEAVSPAGAAGLWQFIRTSGALYMAIDDRVDQRFDPYPSTRAAARFLGWCHGRLKSWPLAVMAYNNGAGQMLDAVRETGSRDPGEIIQSYQAGAFGAVSKNYYAMFLAASSLAMRAETLFPGLNKQAPLPFKTLKLEHEWTPRQLRILSGYSSEVIMRYNPALRREVFERNLAVPKGFELKLPVGLPTSQDLQFADLRIMGADERAGAPASSQGYMAGLPIPDFMAKTVARVRNTLFPEGSREDLPLMAYMHSQGLLDFERLALAKQDNILIEPHPALQAVIKGMAKKRG